jgi:divalent metal cation (Fe/Co/Zn/Cd) transporter
LPPISPWDERATDRETHTVGFYAGIWWLDALGGLILSLVVITNWSQTSFEHIRHLSGFSATADQRNICETTYPSSASAASS